MNLALFRSELRSAVRQARSEEPADRPPVIDQRQDQGRPGPPTSEPSAEPAHAKGDAR